MATPREKTAFHEAAHSCVAALLGRPYGCRLHSDTSGAAGTSELKPVVSSNYTVEKLEPHFTGDPMQEQIDMAAIAAAGSAATALLAFDPMVCVSSGDREMLFAIAAATFPENDLDIQRAFIQLAIARSKKLLHDHWQAVEAVASELVLHGAVSADRVAEIMQANP